MSDERKKINSSIDLILRYGEIDGAHHKQWVLTEVLKTLMGEDEFKNFIKKQENDEEYGPWDEGIAP